MLEVGKEFRADWKGRPPGMSRIDRTIWREYCRNEIHAETEIYYNVRLGPMPAGIKKYPPGLRHHWWSLCCRRIDAVIILPDQVNIYEVRNNATESAIARLMIYGDLWEEEAVSSNPPELFLITNIENQGIRSATEAQGINYILIE